MGSNGTNPLKGGASFKIVDEARPFFLKWVSRAYFVCVQIDSYMQVPVREKWGRSCVCGSGGEGWREVESSETVGGSWSEI